MSTQLPKDDLYEVMANRRRRYTVHALEGTEEPMEIGDIAETVAAWENDVDPDRVSYDERKRVYTALQQSHLPKMDDDGIVSFDRNRGTVEMTELAEELRVYLEVVQGSEIPWSEYYLGLSAVCVALVVAAYLGVLPGAVPDIGLAGAIALIFAFSAGINVYRQRQRRIQFANSRQAATDEDGGVDPETLADTDPEETEPDGAEGAGEGAATAGTVEE